MNIKFEKVSDEVKNKALSELKDYWGDRVCANSWLYDVTERALKGQLLMFPGGLNTPNEKCFFRNVSSLAKIITYKE